ncbi:hybrid sensor histidine kinase/response regulator [Pseudomonas sp. UBA6310]|uniref:hybrid sensor histidine kinase/response regulator n=1 Tax=Pseudomonas sp. UBA6310 TaxID=1947327 RepID=UPI0025804DCB|nr:hybrid sensor histidine kinase/response regulator [Pseudomonas sp. UBA6310]
MIRPAPSTRDTERSQALVRLVLSSIATLYVMLLYLTGYLVEAQLRSILIYNAAFLVASFALIAWIVRKPGVKPVRRLLAMVHDYAAITFAMIIGGEAMLPVYGALLWVTVGNGMRYGTRYLTLATGLALLSIGVMALLSPYLWQNPFVPLTLLVTTFMVPAYAHVLLTRTRQASEQAQTASLAKSRLLAQASHDLRQPIHSISLFTACLRDARLGDEERRMVDNIDRSLLSVEQLFRSILDVYTLDNGQVVPSAEVLAMDEVLAGLVRQNTEAARWAGVTIKVRPSRCHVRCDPALLGTLLQNVLSNALKYAPGKALLIGCRHRDGGLAIEIHDRGPGIDAQDLPHLFDEFYRVRRSRDHDVEGVGLGLSIVKRIAEMLGLGVRIRSRPGHGTSVAIEGLPLSRADQYRPAQHEGSNRRLLTGLRVLLIEDDRDVLLATATLLQKWGCEVHSATSALDTTADFDLVITDFDLGRSMSGADCIDYLNRLHGRRVPAIVITGHDVRKAQQALNDTQVPVLAKPVRPAELRSMLLALKLDLQARSA